MNKAYKKGAQEYSDELVIFLNNAYRWQDYYIYDPEYEVPLKRMRTEPMNQERIEYLCSRIDDPKGKKSQPLRFIHLQPLFLNPTARQFDLHDYLLDHVKQSRRMWMKLYFIRAFAQYATEDELVPLMKKFQGYRCGYEDFTEILSPAGLPYLVKTYGYSCFVEALDVMVAREQEEIVPNLRNLWTNTEDGDHVRLYQPEEVKRRFSLVLDSIDQFIEKGRNKS